MKSFFEDCTQIDNLELIREKDGVHVYRCTYEGLPAVAKYFENESDKCEIRNYRTLTELQIPTIKVLAYGEAFIVMEDISASHDWRLGVKEDMQDEAVAERLAHWHFALHEKGTTLPNLDTFTGEFDQVNEASLNMLCEKMTEAADTFRYILAHYGKLRKLVDTPIYTLTYNDFYWTNFVVRKDKQAAHMFDYNLLGRGYVYSDLRNVCSSLSKEARTAFTNEYDRLYFSKHGTNRTERELEKRIDDVMCHLHTLGCVCDFAEGKFPKWAEHSRQKALDGTLLKAVETLLNTEFTEEQ